jgi:hypothetical protein
LYPLEIEIEITEILAVCCQGNIDIDINIDARTHAHMEVRNDERITVCIFEKKKEIKI